MITESIHRLEKEIPYGYQRKSYGRIVAGDMVWMPKYKAFREPMDLNMSDRVRDYAFVIELKEVGR